MQTSMDNLEHAIQAVIEAKSQSEKASALKRVSRKFYFLCLQAGMKREEILSLAAEIVDCFTEDVKVLRDKVEKRPKR